MNEHSTKYDAKRTDLIQTVQFDTKEQMIAFCQSIQHASPINTLCPEPVICLVMKMMMSSWQQERLARILY